MRAKNMVSKNNKSYSQKTTDYIILLICNVQRRAIHREGKTAAARTSVEGR
jgi:hypothetical protein